MDKILIEIPTWLGDSVMITPAIENIIKLYPNIKITIFGSYIATAIFKQHPNVENIIIDKSREAKYRFIWLYHTAKKLKFNAVFAFRRRFSSKFFAFFIITNKRYHYKRYTKKSLHQVIRYNDFINVSLNINTTPKKLKIYGNYQHQQTDKKILGINPGASYGNAKCWYPQEFAKVAITLSSQYDIIIFGGPYEINIAHNIEVELNKNNIKNYQNIAGKTNIAGLIKQISKIDLLITGDSGPMHIAAALQIPTMAIFGPTKYKETNQWKNSQSKIIHKDFECMPCMQRVCYLSDKKNHQCMKSITAQNVLDKINQTTNENFN